MPELDPEILARVLRWCAEAGAPTRGEAVRAALEPLSWDDLLAVKAAIADPPPRRGLGPAELVALARGASRAPRSRTGRPRAEAHAAAPCDRARDGHGPAPPGH